MTVPEPLSPKNTTVVLIDHAVGFANVIRSHHLSEHVGNVVGLAQTALLYRSGLVVTNGEDDKPHGPLYPELLAALGDHPVVTRHSAVAFNGFADEGFTEAVAATGRPNLVIAGFATDGCVLQTCFGAIRAGYTVHVVVDATASTTRETHDAGVARLVQAGVVPVGWWSLAAEFQLDPDAVDSPARMTLMNEHQLGQVMASRTFFAGAEVARRAATAG